MGLVDLNDEMTFGKKISDVKEAVKSTINSLGWKIKDESGNTIECSKGFNLLSVGSNLLISIKSVGNKTNVEIHSKDKLGIAGSLGGNLNSRRNIKQFFDKLTQKVAAL